jgi:hypothetical protein
VKLTSAVRLWTVVGGGLLLSLGLLTKTSGLNGAGYWTWFWRDLGLVRVAILLAQPLLIYALAQRRIEYLGASTRPRREACFILGALVACNLLWQAGALLADPAAPLVLRFYVEAPWVTGYYTDAIGIGDVRLFLSNFHTENLELHSNTHPPGPILHYWFWLKILEPKAAAYAGALCIGFVASLGVPVLYRFASLWTSERTPRLVASSIYAMTPSIIVFLPWYDTTYPILMMLMSLFWAKALGGKRRYGAFFGGVLFVSTFFAYTLLTVGASLVLMASLFLARDRRPGVVGRLASATALAIGTTLGLHALLAVATGYDAWASFLQALRNQEGVNERLGRGWSRCVVYDPFDFALGGGMVTTLLCASSLFRSGEDPRRRWLSLIGFATILIVDLTGLLRAETMRVWTFLQPWLIVPSGLELARYPLVDRARVLGTLWLVLASMVTKLTFSILHWPPG